MNVCPACGYCPHCGRYSGVTYMPNAAGPNATGLVTFTTPAQTPLQPIPHTTSEAQ